MQQISGPKGHPLHGCWLELRRDPLGFLMENTALYGDVFRFRLGLRRCWAIAAPDLIRAVFTERDGALTDRAQSQRMELAFPRVLARVEGVEHKELRSTLAATLRPEAVTARAQGALDVATSVLARHPGGPCEALPLFCDLALRTATALLLGDVGQDVIDTVATELPRMETWLTYGSEDEAAYDRAKEALGAALVEAGRRRARSSAAIASPIDPLLHAVDGSKMDVRRLVDEMVMLLITYRPMAHAATWALYELGHAPEVRAALEEELEPATRSSAPSPDALARAPLLLAVVMETLRLHPPVWVLSREARQQLRLGPLLIEKGNEVMVSPYVVQRSPRYWEDPNAFRPDRFATRGCPRPPAAFMPFGLGTRRCIGERASVLQIQLMLATLLSRFCVELAPSDAPRPGTHPILPANGLPVILEERRSPVRKRRPETERAREPLPRHAP